MTTDAEIEKDVRRLCEDLRSALKAIGNSPQLVQSKDTLDELVQLADKIKEITERPALAGKAPGDDDSIKHPNIRVDLADLDAGRITRRVSYAMRDAGIDEKEIERYEEQMRSAADPMEVARRWVSVT